MIQTDKDKIKEVIDILAHEAWERGEEIDGMMGTDIYWGIAVDELHDALTAKHFLEVFLMNVPHTPGTERPKCPA